VKCLYSFRSDTGSISTRNRKRLSIVRTVVAYRCRFFGWAADGRNGERNPRVRKRSF